MNCPVCGGETKVTYTDRYENVIVRVRKCVKCGAIEMTDEIPRRSQSISKPSNLSAKPT